MRYRAHVLHSLLEGFVQRLVLFCSYILACKQAHLCVFGDNVGSRAISASRQSQREEPYSSCATSSEIAQVNLLKD